MDFHKFNFVLEYNSKWFEKRPSFYQARKTILSRKIMSDTHETGILRSLINGYTYLLFSRKKILSTPKFSSDKRVGRKRPTVVKMPPYLFIQSYPFVRDLKVVEELGKLVYNSLCSREATIHIKSWILGHIGR